MGPERREDGVVVSVILSTARLLTKSRFSVTREHPCQVMGG